MSARTRVTSMGVAAVGGQVVLFALAAWAAITMPSRSWAWGPRVVLTFTVQGPARLMCVLVPLIAAPVMLYAAVTTEPADRKRLLAWLTAFTGAMELLVVAGDFLTLLIGWELVGACSWALIGFAWRDIRKPFAARDAFVVTRAGDVGLYLAAAAMFATTGALDFAYITALHGTGLTVVALGLFVAAAAKSAQLPFSPWLFRAMAGPTPASALLHSATMVAAGAYALARLLPSLVGAGAAWLSPSVLWLGIATAIAGGLVALMQRDLKCALAASTSAQYGLMFAAVGAGVPAAAGLHLATHAAFKSLLFLGAGIAMHGAGTLELDELQLGRRLPRVAAAFWIGAAALGGIPPLGGGYTKEQVIAAVERVGPWAAGCVIVAGALSVAYAGRLALLAFGPPRGEDTRKPMQTPAWAALAALAWLALMSLAFTVLWLPGAGAAAARLLDGHLAAGNAYTQLLSLGAIAVSAWLTWLFWKRSALLDFGLPSSLTRWIVNWFELGTLARTVVGTPAFALANALARVDDRAVDAGIRATARLTREASHLLAWLGERGIDGVVRGVAASGVWLAFASRTADDAGVDVAVERVARGIDVTGSASRRLQTGMLHHYYLFIVASVVILVAAAFWR